MRKIWKSIVAAAGGIALLLSPLETYASVGMNVDYHSVEDITRMAQTTILPAMRTEDTWDVKPNLKSAPYSEGKVSQQTLQNGLNTLKFIRYVAGIPYNIQIKDQYQTLAQSAAVVSAVNGELSHYPLKPSGMGDELYENGSAGAGRSNLAVAASEFSTPKIFTAFKLWMDDWQISWLGHRRWTLRPSLGYTGLGVAGNYYAFYVDDDSNQNASGYSGVAWPAQNMPLELMYQGPMRWSITFANDLDSSSIHVKLTDKNTKKIWNLSSGGGNGTLKVDTSGYGQGSCVMFEPNGLETFKDGDAYSVEITGQDALGNPVYTSYDVRFFWAHQHTGGYASCGMGALCSICGTEYGQAGLHHMGQWRVDKKATSTSNGRKVRECEWCGYLEEQTIPKTSAKTVKLTLNKQSVTINRKKTFTLKATKKPASKVTFSTSNKKVATVSAAGRITAAGAGTATITVKCGGQTAKCKVTVPGTTKISNIRSSLRVKRGKTVTLKPRLTYVKTRDKVTYKSSNSKVVSVSSKGKIKARKKDTATITVTSGNVRTRCKITVK